MLQPTRLKYRKQQKGRNTGIATRGNKVSFGEFGLKAVGRGRLTARQIEAARRTMTRHIKRAEIKPGKVLYEMDGVPESLAREAFELAAAKLPIPTTFVVRQVGQ